MAEQTNQHAIPRRRMAAILPMAVAAVAASAVAQENRMSPFDELFEASRTEKKGLTLYVGGQTIPGVVVKVNGSESVEVRNQMHSRVVIRLDRIDAVAIA